MLDFEKDVRSFYERIYNEGYMYGPKGKERKYIGLNAVKFANAISMLMYDKIKIEED